MGEKNFGYLGHGFQLSLINLLITDKKFCLSIIPSIDPKYFDNQYFRLIVSMIKEFVEKYENIVPSFDILEQLNITENASEVARKIVGDTIKEVMETTVTESAYYKEKALKFCKQQELYKAIKKVEKIINKGDFENYDSAEEIIREALTVGNEEEEKAEDVFEESLDEVLSDDYRHPIPTGIHGLDHAMKGGLGKGELGLGILATGCGKTSLACKFASTAYKMGYNVLQIFFEDKMKNIKRKHICGITGISPDEQHLRKDEVKKLIAEFKVQQKGKLILKKYPSETLTFPEIKQRILKVISEGNKLDMILIDYVDCVISGGEDYEKEGTLMRRFEALFDELDVVGWIFTQGGRASISADVVTTDLMGGSIKKGQVAHVIITGAKTLIQKENKLGTLAITKSRIGDDGIVFENCKFDNEYLDIDTTTCSTFLGFEETKEQKEQVKAQKRIQEAQRLLRQTLQQNNNL